MKIRRRFRANRHVVERHSNGQAEHRAALRTCRVEASRKGRDMYKIHQSEVSSSDRRTSGLIYICIFFISIPFARDSSIFFSNLVNSFANGLAWCAKRYSTHEFFGPRFNYMQLHCPATSRQPCFVVFRDQPAQPMTVHPGHHTIFNSKDCLWETSLF